MYNQIDATHGACIHKRMTKAVVQTIQLEQIASSMSTRSSSPERLVGLRVSTNSQKYDLEPKCCSSRNMTDSVDMHYDNRTSLEEEHFASLNWLSMDGNRKGGRTQLRITAKTPRVLDVLVQ